VRIGVSVAKKKMPHSVDRQRGKRLLREAWRLHKHELYACIPPGTQLHLFLLLTSPDMPTYAKVEQSVQQIIATLAKQFQQG
jgi:ribonuclease P protein component